VVFVSYAAAWQAVKIKIINRKKAWLFFISSSFFTDNFLLLRVECNSGLFEDPPIFKEGALISNLKV